MQQRSTIINLSGSRTVNIILFVFALAVCALSCTRQKAPMEAPATMPCQDTTESVQYDYHAFPCYQKTTKGDSITVTTDTGRISIMHHNYFTLCCHYVWSVCWKHKDTIFVCENDSGGPTTCVCFYPIATSITRLHAGQFRLYIKQRSRVVLDTLVTIP